MTEKVLRLVGPQTDVILVQITERTFLSPFSLYSAILTVLSSV